jgi:hypothetical protein
MTAEIEVKQVEPLHVLTVRRRLGDQNDVVRALGELLPAVTDVIAGSPMALKLGFPRDGKTDFDLAFPIAEPLTRDGFTTGTLPTLPMFSITHLGPLTSGPEGSNLADTWKHFIDFVQRGSILVGDDPQRFIYHEGLESAGSKDERFVLEIQYSYHLPIWLDALEEGVTQRAGAGAAARVMAGSEGMVEALDGHRTAEWIQDAVERLDREVPDERDRACVLNACAHHYIVQSGDLLAAAWENVGHDLRALVQKITDEPFLGSKYWIDESGLEPLLYIERRPARQEAYDQATDPVEKRYQACFCPLVRDAIRSGKSVSRTFCHCSGGWYVQEWEIVFGRKPEVQLVRTMLEGEDSCLFAVKIPPELLRSE